MTHAYLNRLAVAVPEYEVHGTFVRFAERALRDRQTRLLFQRMVSRSQISRRWSCLSPAAPGANACLDGDGFYAIGHFPSTDARMRRYAREAPVLAAKTVARLDLGEKAGHITHLIVTSCTGFSAPGVDFELIRRCHLRSCIERNVLGFMGCNAAINALKLARHIVRSAPDAMVLVVSIELCTLHLQESDNVERLLTYLLFADGCAAVLISAEPSGFALEEFHAEIAPATAEHITWNIGDNGFDMLLSGELPATIRAMLQSKSAGVLSGASANEIDLWAVHPGGRTVLDAVEGAFDLGSSALKHSREVLRAYGNMSSPTVLFVLEALMREQPARGTRGCAMAFGPGLTTETMLFSAAG